MKIYRMITTDTLINLTTPQPTHHHQTMAAQPAQTECSICLEPFNKMTRKAMSCEFCHHTSCASCNKRYILESFQTPHCMSCRRECSLSFLVSLGKKWCNEEYRAMRETMLLEHEKTFLPALQVRASYQKKYNQFDRKLKSKHAEAKENEKNIDQLVRTQMATRERIKGEIDVICNEWRQVEHPLLISDGESRRVAVVMKCTIGECRGFLTSQRGHYKCELCDSHICKECHCVKADGHECKADDVATVAELERSTKPCPSCHIRIYKIDGCDQMFCLQCHTAFSWRTGQIETGVIHNPHYFEALRAGNIRDPRHYREHGGCGPIPTFTSIRPIVATLDAPSQDRMTNMYQRLSHLRTVTLPLYNRADDNEVERDRINYLIDEITETKFKAKLFVRHQRAQRKREEREILESYVGIGEEMFRTLTRDNALEIVQQLMAITQVSYDAVKRIDEKYQHKGLIQPSDIAL